MNWRKAATDLDEDPRIRLLLVVVLLVQVLLGCYLIYSASRAIATGSPVSSRFHVDNQLAPLVVIAGLICVISVAGLALRLPWAYYMESAVLFSVFLLIDAAAYEGLQQDNRSTHRGSWILLAIGLFMGFRSARHFVRSGQKRAVEIRFIDRA